MKRLWAAGILIAAYLSGCGGGPTAGGTIETTNGLSAMVVLPDQSPVVGARVYRIPSEGWLDKVQAGQSVILDSTVTDAAGKFTLAGGSAPVGVWIQADSQAAFFPEMDQGQIDSQFHKQLALGPILNSQGVVLSPDLQAQRVFLAGTPFSGTVDSAGAFTLAGIPAQKYSALVQLDSGGTPRYAAAGNLPVTPGMPGADTLYPESGGSLLLEDFEDLDNRGRLGPILGGGWWSAYSDAYTGGTSILLSPADAGPVNFAAAIQDGGSGHERALRVRYLLGSNGLERSYPFVYASLDIGSTHYNLSHLDSLTFWGKGNGSIRVELVQNISGLNLAAWWRVDLDTVGRVITLKPADLQVDVWQFPTNLPDVQPDLLAAGLPAYTAAPTTWAEMGDKARAVRFVGIAGDEFWLDDIRLVGPSLQDLNP